MRRLWWYSMTFTQFWTIHHKYLPQLADVHNYWLVLSTNDLVMELKTSVVVQKQAESFLCSLKESIKRKLNHFARNVPTKSLFQTWHKTRGSRVDQNYLGLNGWPRGLWLALPSPMGPGERRPIYISISGMHILYCTIKRPTFKNIYIYLFYSNKKKVMSSLHLPSWAL